MDKWISAKDLAEVLGLAEQTLASWRVEGKGPVFVKAGRRVFYRPEDIERWAQENTRQAT